MPSRNYSGRYGSGAWLRWFKRRYRSTNLPVVQNQTVTSFVPVIVVFEPERIIFIMSTLPPTNITAIGDDNDKTQRALSVSNGVQQPHDPVEQAFASMIESAELVAQLRAKAFVSQEIRKGGRETIISIDFVDSSIDIILNEYIQTLSPEQRSLLTKQNFPQFEKAFANEYKATIKERLQAAKMSGKLYDDRTIAIRKIALQDKQVFNTLDSPEHLRYLAVSRAMEELGIDAIVTRTNLNDIHIYVEDYCKLYNLSKEVNNGSPESTF